MPALVVNGVCRYAIRQSIGGQQAVNIIDMRIDTTASTLGREDAVIQVGKDLLNAWSGNVLATQANEVAANEVYYLDLDETDGPVGTITSTDDNTWPMNGGQTSGGVLPAVVAMRVDKQTRGGRGTKQGRMYLVGMREQDTGDDVAQSWLGSWITSVNGALADFLSAINDGNDLSDLEQSMCVVHRIGDSATGTSTDVTGLTVNPLISTQVRRGVLR